MPIAPCDYSPPRFCTNPDLLTIFTGAIRPAASLPYHRERISFGDGDFLDLDWLAGASNRLAIITHGLTGSSRGRHVSRMAQALHLRGWNVLAWNFLGASEEINRGIGWYHSGSSDQLRTVITHAVNQNRFASIALIGFSLGGNVTLKYLGEEEGAVPAAISSAVVFSVPCDLKACAYRLAAPRNRIYMRHFLKNLGAKLREKSRLHPTAIDLSGYDSIKNFIEYDERWTAPLHGFKSAEDYWRRSSSRRLIPAIKIPTTVISAHDDPFLPPDCFPVPEAQANPNLTLQIPRNGGHMGFIDSLGGGELWSERCAPTILEVGSERTT
ncbi:MAG: hypothetical protein RL417_129 [Pseudomonadota bacterium]|jgi:predicted alpha/beta-fold hydrolase